MGWKRKAANLLDLLYPPHCVFCGAALPPGAAVCEDCKRSIACLNTVRRMNPVGKGKDILCMAPYLYRDQVRASIKEFKFHGHKEFAGFYAESIAAQLKTEPGFCADVITAVPISKSRMEERGYNQSELIARELAGLLQLPYCECLKKIKENKIQHDLKKEQRFDNVRGVYAPVHSERVEGRAVLLVDDIVTTGATLLECCRMLYIAGAETVVCAAAASVL